MGGPKAVLLGLTILVFSFRKALTKISGNFARGPARWLDHDNSLTVFISKS